MKRLLPLLLLWCLPAFAGLSPPMALNYDLSVNSEFRAGNKPVAGAACPTGWTCAAKGDGTEDIDEVSATSFLMVTSGTNDEAGDIGYVYKTTATDDDIQIIARIPSSWTGHLENATQFGVGNTEGTDAADYTTNCYWRNGSAHVLMKSDATGAGKLQQTGLSNQTRPRYIAYVYDVSATTEACWESSDGFEWFQVGSSVTKSLTFPVLTYVYGTSHIASATTTATLTDIDFSNTITIGVEGGGGGGGANVAPVFNSTPIVTGTAGTAKSITIINIADTTDATKRASDENGDALTLTEQGCTWPTGVSVSSGTGTVEIATNAVAGTTTNCRIGVSDGIEARVDSDPFSIVIDPAGGGEEDAELIWEGLLEGGSGDIAGGSQADFKTKTAGQGQHSVVTTGTGTCTNPRQGTRMAKVEIPSGATGTPQRAEIKSLPNVNFEWDGTEYWVGFSYCGTAASSFSGVHTLFQVHAPNEGPGECDMAGNAVGLMYGNTLSVIENPSGISSGGGANSDQINVYQFSAAAAAAGGWQDFVLNFSLSKTGDGFYNFWHNGVLVASGTDASNVNWKDECGNVIQPPKDKSNGGHFGLYQGNTTPRILYMDSMRIAVGDNGYNTVDPAQDD